MVIIENGFLDEKFNNLIISNKTSNKEFFDLLYDYNKLLHKVLYNFDGIKQNNEINYIVPAFAKLVKLFQSCVIMLEYGMPDISESMLRSIYDLKFQMLYVLKNDINYQRLIKRMFSKELGKLNYIDKHSLYDYVSKDDVENIRKVWNFTIEQLKDISCAPDTRQMCEELGLEEEYVFYSMLCNNSHQSCDVIYSLNKDFGIDILPDFVNIYLVGFRLCNAIDLVLNKIITKYAPHLNEEYNKLIEQCNKLFEKTKEE